MGNQTSIDSLIQLNQNRFNMSQTTNPPHLMSESPLTDFSTYYRKKIRPYLLDLERKREAFLAAYRVHERNYLIISAMVGILLCALTIWFGLLGSLKWVFSLLMLALPILVMKYWLAPVMKEKEAHNERHEAFYNRYKSKVIESMVKFFDNSLKLAYEEQISKDTVRNSRLVQNLSHVEVVGDDFVSGSVYGIPVTFSELQLSDVSEKPFKAIFHGLFFTGVLKEPIQGAAFIMPKTVLPNHIWGELGEVTDAVPLRDHHRAHNIKVMEGFMAKLNPWNPGGTGLELRPIPINVKTAKANYTAFATFPDQAASLVNDDFWQLLFPPTESSDGGLLDDWTDKTNFLNTVSTGFYISIIGDRIYVMQPQGGDLFEPDMNQSFLEESGLTNYHENLQKVFSMMYHFQQKIEAIAS